MMTLSEAIEHAEWAANNCEGECSDEHRQLAEWLRDLRKRQLVDDALQDERSLLFERLGDYGVALGDARMENLKLRELMRDLYCLAYPSTVEWEVSHETYNKYSPCERCHELHDGKSPCASTSKDMTEECCKPIQANVVADRMRELGIEVE